MTTTTPSMIPGASSCVDVSAGATAAPTIEKYYVGFVIIVRMCLKCQRLIFIVRNALSPIVLMLME